MTIANSGSITLIGPETLATLLAAGPEFVINVMTGSATTSGGTVQSAALSPDRLVVNYDSASSSYSLSTSGGSETFSPADLASSGTTGHASYVNPDGSTLDLYTAQPHTPSAPREYVALGLWQQGSVNDGTATFETFTFGIPTPAAAAPRTGEAAYDVDMIGRLSVPGAHIQSVDGPGVFEADFLTGRFKADISPNITDLVTGGGTFGGLTEVVAEGALSGSDATFSGTSSFENGVNVYYVGSISGQLYGPAGQEVGATVTGDNPNGGQFVGSFFGAQTGNPPSENLTLTNIYTDQLFSVQGIDGSVQAGESGGLVGGFTTVTPTQLTIHAGGASFISGIGTSPWPAALYTSANVVASTLPNFTAYQQTIGGLPAEIDLYNVGPGNTELALTYMDIGLWRIGSGIPPQNQMELYYGAFGMLTDQGELSRMTGSAHYAGIAYGGADDATLATFYNVTGTTAVDVNFTAQTLSGSLSLSGTPSQGGPGVSFGTFTFSSSLEGSPFGGTLVDLSQAGSVGGGQLNIRFYGPAAEELGGPFYIQLNNQMPHTTNIWGVTAAKRN